MQPVQWHPDGSFTLTPCTHTLAQLLVRALRLTREGVQASYKVTVPMQPTITFYVVLQSCPRRVAGCAALAYEAADEESAYVAGAADAADVTDAERARVMVQQLVAEAVEACKARVQQLWDAYALVEPDACASALQSENLLRLTMEQPAQAMESVSGSNFFSERDHLPARKYRDDDLAHAIRALA